MQTLVFSFRHRLPERPVDPRLVAPSLLFEPGQNVGAVTIYLYVQNGNHKTFHVKHCTYNSCTYTIEHARNPMILQARIPQVTVRQERGRAKSAAPSVPSLHRFAPKRTQLDPGQKNNPPLPGSARMGNLSPASSETRLEKPVRAGELRTTTPALPGSTTPACRRSSANSF